MLGSSARKLRRLEVNLLAGRAIRREFCPLTGREMDYDFTLSELLAFGTLPAIRTDVGAAVDVLEAYTTTYLREEIQQESLLRDLPSFSRFLEVAALANGQVASVASIARDAGVARPTVQRYFDVLVDTLIGVWVHPWRASARVKEVGHPKFYFFDTGVVRALRGATREPLERAERGPLLETLILHELRAHMAIAGTGGEISYWGTPSGGEVDFIWRRGKRAVGIEVKAANRYRREDAGGAPRVPRAQARRLRVRGVRRAGHPAGRRGHGPAGRGVHAPSRARRRGRVKVGSRTPEGALGLPGHRVAPRKPSVLRRVGAQQTAGRQHAAVRQCDDGGMDVVVRLGIVERDGGGAVLFVAPPRHARDPRCGSGQSNYS
jgi:hypothetical protein